MFSANQRGEEVDAFLFRRIRPLFEGTLFGNVDFRFMPDFGQNNSQIQEAFLELKTLPLPNSASASSKSQSDWKSSGRTAI